MLGKFRTVLIAVLLSLCLLTLVAGTLTASRQPAVPLATAELHVVLIVIDTLRTDHVSSYGYARNTTPNLDSQIAGQGARFEAFTTSPWTCPSNAALFTGRFPSVVGATWETMGESIPDAEITLAEYLHEAGYYTAGFTSRAYCVRGNLGFSQGFDHYDDGVQTGIPSGDPIRAGELNNYVFDWLDNAWVPVISGGGQPLFLYIYYFDPHTWYDPPPPYDTLYDPTYTGDLTPELFGHGESAKSGELILTPRDLEHLLALYDGEITYLDVHLGALFDKLAALNMADDSLIVITADHGEMFSEHDEWSHAGSLYEEVLRVPLLLRYPGFITPGLQISVPVQSMDLMPTILDYVNITPTAALQALSLRPLLSGQPGAADRAIYSEVDQIEDPSSPLAWASPPDDLRTVMWEGWKYIAHLNHFEANELYQLAAASPYEGVNLIHQQPARARDMFRQLMDWFFPFRDYLPAGLRSAAD